MPIVQREKKTTWHIKSLTPSGAFAIVQFDEGGEESELKLESEHSTPAPTPSESDTTATETVPLEAPSTNETLEETNSAMALNSAATEDDGRGWSSPSFFFFLVFFFPCMGVDAKKETVLFNVWLLYNIFNHV